MTAANQPVRRRGRPPQVAAPSAPQATDAPRAETKEAVPPSRRRPRASAGGFALKLDAPQREGFVRRFVNNTPGRLQAMEDLGYTLVNDSAGAAESRTEGLGTRISRHAGVTDRGEAMQTFLMETPAAEFNYGVADKEEARKPFEEAIRRTSDPTGQVDGAYAPNTKSTLQT